MHIAPELIATHRGRQAGFDATVAGDIYALASVIYQTMFRQQLADADVLHMNPSEYCEWRGGGTPMCH
jgi:hypothetical protein